MSYEINFSRVCGSYLWTGFLLAVFIPPEYRAPAYLTPLLERLPFVSLFQSPVNHLSSIPIFFLVMWMLMPVVLFLLAKHPQKDLPIYSNRSGLRLVYATAVAVAAFLLLASASYSKGEISSAAARGSAVILLAAKYRVFLGIVGSAFMVATAIFTYILFVLMPKLWFRYFSDDN